MKMTEIRQLSDADLAARIAQERGAYDRLRFNHTVAGLESTTVIKNKRRDIARLLTELNGRNQG
ncbi:MAG: 50S ribosomal protein L29 [Flavobacteriales bacterium]|jgi:large subunit ribosomal protein L29